MKEFPGQPPERAAVEVEARFFRSLRLKSRLCRSRLNFLWIWSRT